MLIKAHPTKYAGVIFRSRLEATWAAFFDLSGIRWNYEPIDLDGWSPDFVLWLVAPVYVEVKPAPMIKQDGFDWLRVDSSFGGFQKAKNHWQNVNVLLLGVQPNDEADYFGIGTLLDPADGTLWADILEALRVKSSGVRWKAAQSLTQWVPA